MTRSSLHPFDGFVSYASFLKYVFTSNLCKNKRTLHGTVALFNFNYHCTKTRNMSTLVKIVCYSKEGGDSFIFKGSDFIPLWEKPFTTHSPIFCHITDLNMLFANKALWEFMAGIPIVLERWWIFNFFIIFTTGSWGISPNHLRFWTLIWFLPTSAVAWGASHHVKCTWCVSECVLIGLKAKSGEKLAFLLLLSAPIILDNFLADGYV